MTRLAAILLCLLTSSAGAIEISEPRWGFDGKIRAQRFNLLTITVDNPSPQPVEFDLVLRKSLGGVNFIDAPVIEHVFLAPGTRRTVQFYPYVTHDWGSWRLSWGRDSTEIIQPRTSRRNARVLLDSMDVLGDSKGSMRRFPEQQFPASVTGTDTLQAVLLDHAPNWDEARRTAFLDWIYRGGAVFVLQGSNGKFPEFPAALSQLNAPLESVSFGSGVIRKVSRTRSQLSPTETRDLWRLLPNQFVAETTIQVDGLTANPNSPDDDDDEDDRNRRFNYGDGGRSINSRSFLDELKKMTRPEHNWLLLHFMFWVYILLIFPGCFLIGKQRNDFRVVYLAIIAIVVVFSLAFGIVGQRGYGEATRIDSVAIVSPLPDGYLDVTQWSNAFVTGGAYYDLKHKGTGTLYSTCQETEAVNGLIKNGAEAIFRVDIPPFSSREYAHRIKVAGTLPPVKIEHYSAGESGLKELTLAIDNTFPPTDELCVLYRDRFYSVSREKDRLVMRNNVGTVPAYLRVEQEQNYFSPFGGYGEEERSSERRYRDLFSTLATRSLNIRTLADAQAVRWSPESVRLMYYADLLPELTVQNPRFPQKDQKGKALYCITLPLEGVVNQNAEEKAK